MNSIIKSEVLIATILIAILVAFLQPFGLSMPDSSVSMLIVALIIAFLLFASVVWKEETKDERESLHKLQAGQISFIVGAGILIVGIIVQSLQHNIDVWLIITLVGMILTKVFSRLYSAIKH